MPTRAGADAATLLRQAEAAMYQAKHRGDLIAVYRPEAAHHPADRLALLADLRRALRLDPGEDGIGPAKERPCVGIGERSFRPRLLHQRDLDGALGSALTGAPAGRSHG